MTTSARATTPSPFLRFFGLDGVGGDVRADRFGRDPEIAAEVHAVERAGTGEPVDVSGFNSEPFGYLTDREQPYGLESFGGHDASSLLHGDFLSRGARAGIGSRTGPPVVISSREQA